jgi:hypothetical protein
MPSTMSLACRYHQFGVAAGYPVRGDGYRGGRCPATSVQVLDEKGTPARGAELVPRRGLGEGGDTL